MVRRVRAFSISAVTLLVGSAACGPGVEPTETIELVDKRDLDGVWSFTPPTGEAPRVVTLKAQERRLELSEADGSVAASVPIDHLDLVLCYDGCGRSCRLTDDVTRAWTERAYVTPLSPLPELRRSGTSSTFGESLEVWSGEVCARSRL